MANVMAPCTDSIMGSLPRAKAGVGSAVNDTTRQMGGAVGVAVFGSLMASHFTTSMTGKIGGDPRRAVRSGEGQRRLRRSASPRAPGAQPFRAQIVAAANDSFVSGLHIVALVAAGITLLAAVGVLIFLPARARDEVDVAPPRPSSSRCPWGWPDDARATRGCEAEVRPRSGRPARPRL